jgi:hypothetical protein
MDEGARSLSECHKTSAAVKVVTQEWLTGFKAIAEPCLSEAQANLKLAKAMINAKKRKAGPPTVS